MITNELKPQKITEHLSVLETCISEIESFESTSDRLGNVTITRRENSIAVNGPKDWRNRIHVPYDVAWWIIKQYSLLNPNAFPKCCPTPLDLKGIAIRAYYYHKDSAPELVHIEPIIEKLGEEDEKK